MLRKFLVLTVLALIVLAPAFATDVTGKWTAEFETPIGVLHYTYELKVDGEKLTGTAAWEQGSTEILEGAVSGEKISFVEEIEIEGNKLRIEYTGEVSGDEIRFHRVVGDFGSEDFVAKKTQ